jgi:hypothetical protein
LITKRRLKIALGVVVAMIVAFAGFIYFAVGGFDRYGPPINILIAKGFSGVACGRWLAGEQREEATWTLDARGYFTLSEEVRSHRPRVIQLVDAATGARSPAPDEIWHPIYTENSPKDGATYLVVWVGDIKGWNKHRAANASGSICLGRF